MEPQETKQEEEEPSEEVQTLYFTVVIDSGTSDGRSVYSVEEGSQIDDPGIPEREGYVFAGWYMQSETGEELLYDFSTEIREDSVIYAKWDTYTDPEWDQEGVTE